MILCFSSRKIKGGPAGPPAIPVLVGVRNLITKNNIIGIIEYVNTSDF